MDTTTSYVPYDYRRTCDLCGNLFNISKMFRKGPYTYCYAHAGERISEELDRGNARQRPFRILPVPNAKPIDHLAPDKFETEDADVFSLLELVRPAGARYAQVISGSPGPLVNADDVIPINAWAAGYYYGVIVDGHRSARWVTDCTARLRLAADTLLALQTVSGTVATNSYYGGMIATGATNYYSENTATSGLAFLYAYRTLGDIKYLYAARGCANFLRNLQAIGSCGVYFPSSDAAGTARLYTGAVTNYVTSIGMFADHAFYPSGLICLRFWSELKLTDGDQTIGATAAIAGQFTLTPAQSLSQSIADMRSFWETGVYDATRRTIVNGLSAATPAEVFNAYPASKPNTGTGSGSWEYQDGGASTGTLVSALNIAMGVSSLYAVEGLSSQVLELDDWLQAFASNSAYQSTAAQGSVGALAQATTGTYDPKIAPSKYLLVRDPTAAYAATAKNGSALYDWGAFGLMSPIWSARRAGSFKTARNASVLERRRLSDGRPSDGYWDDRGYLRGRQGLSFQTDFFETLTHGTGTGV